MKTSLIVTLGTAMLFWITNASAVDANSKATVSPIATQLNGNDRGFLKRAAKGRAKELQIAKLAGKRARNEDVKTLATKIVSDDKTISGELKELAAKKHFELPKEKLKKERISSDDFDKKCLLALRKESERDIGIFEKEANGNGRGDDSDVRAWAQQVVPILKQNLDLVNSQLGKLK